MMTFAKWLAPLTLAAALVSGAQAQTYTKLNTGIARGVSPNLVGVDIGSTGANYVPFGRISGGAFILPLSYIGDLGTGVAAALAIAANASGGPLVAPAPNSALQYSSITVAGQTCTLGASCSVSRANLSDGANIVPHVATDAALTASATATYPQGVWRDDFYSGGLAGPLLFQPQTGTCAANSMVNDGGSCRNTTAGDGNSWIGVFKFIDPMQFGAKCDGAYSGASGTNDQAAIQAAVTYWASQKNVSLITTNGRLCLTASKITLTGSPTTYARQMDNMRVDASTSFTPSTDYIFDFSGITAGWPWNKGSKFTNNTSDLHSVAAGWLKLGNTYSVIVDSNWIGNPRGDAILKSDTSSGNRSIYSKNFIEGDGVYGGAGINVQGGDADIVDNIISERDCSIKAANNTLISRNHIWNQNYTASDCGIYVTGASNQITDNYVDSVYVTIELPRGNIVGGNKYYNLLQKSATPWAFNRFRPTTSVLFAGFNAYGNSYTDLSPAAATWTASISGTTMTVTAVGSGSLAYGQVFTGTGVSTSPPTMIVSQLTGSAGSTGTYQVNVSQTVSSTGMTSVATTVNDWVVDSGGGGSITNANVYGGFIETGGTYHMGGTPHTTHPYFQCSLSAATSCTYDMSTQIFVGAPVNFLSTSLQITSGSGAAYWVNVSGNVVTCTTASAVTGKCSGRMSVLNTSNPMQ